MYQGDTILYFCDCVWLVESILVIDTSPENAGNERDLKLKVHCTSISRFEKNIYNEPVYRHMLV